MSPPPLPPLSPSLFPTLPPAAVDKDEITPAPVPTQPPTATPAQFDQITPSAPRRSENTILDPVLMTDAVTAEPELFSLYYVFDPGAEHR